MKAAAKAIVAETAITRKSVRLGLMAKPVPEITQTSAERIDTGRACLERVVS